MPRFKINLISIQFSIKNRFYFIRMVSTDFHKEDQISIANGLIWSKILHSFLLYFNAKHFDLFSQKSKFLKKSILAAFSLNLKQFENENVCFWQYRPLKSLTILHFQIFLKLKENCRTLCVLWGWFILCIWINNKNIVG